MWAALRTKSTQMLGSVLLGGNCGRARGKPPTLPQNWAEAMTSRVRAAAEQTCITQTECKWPVGTTPLCSNIRRSRVASAVFWLGSPQVAPSGPSLARLRPHVVESGQNSATIRPNSSKLTPSPLKCGPNPAKFGTASIDKFGRSGSRLGRVLDGLHRIQPESGKSSSRRWSNLVRV